MKKKNILLMLSLAYQDGRDEHRGIVRYMRAHDLPWRIHLIRSQVEMPPRDDWPDFFRRFDGFICDAAPGEFESVAETTARPDELPVVFLNRAPASSAKNTRSTRQVVVNIDSKALGRMAAEVLQKIGYASFAFLGLPKPCFWSTDRRASFLSALRRTGHTAVDLSGDEAAVLSRLKGLPKPTGVFAANDRIAGSFLDACAAAGIRVPEEVGVLGIDNDAIACDYTEPTLSSIQPDFVGLGHLAARSLDALLAGRRTRALLTGKIQGVILRQSTEPTATAGSLVRAAQEYMRHHAREKMTADQIAAALKVSRRLLDLRYRQITDRTLHTDILATRLDLVREEVETTAYTIAELAERLDFSSESYLNRVFKIRFGHSISAHRHPNVETVCS